MSGLWKTVPRLSAVGLFLALASLGLPGLGNFVAEFLILLGSYQRSASLTAVAALGLVGATIYSLWLVQKAFYGPLKPAFLVPDLCAREVSLLGVMMVILLWLGVYPDPVFRTTYATVQTILAGGAP